MRISIVGNSGSGKSTAARMIAQALGIAHLELDAIRHQANWEELPDEEFARQAAAFMDAHEAWVIDGNYSVIQDTIWSRADTVLWMDLPRHENMRNIIWRTVSRALLRTELWNGNRERWQALFATDPYESMIMWAWTRHQVYRDRYGALQHEPRWRHLVFVRLRSRRELRGWIRQTARGIGRSAAAPR